MRIKYNFVAELVNDAGESKKLTGDIVVEVGDDAHAEAVDHLIDETLESKIDPMVDEENSKNVANGEWEWKSTDLTEVGLEEDDSEKPAEVGSAE